RRRHRSRAGAPAREAAPDRREASWRPWTRAAVRAGRTARASWTYRSPARPEACQIDRLRRGEAGPEAPHFGVEKRELAILAAGLEDALARHGLADGEAHEAVPATEHFGRAQIALETPMDQAGSVLQQGGPSAEKDRNERHARLQPETKEIVLPRLFFDA